MGHLSIIFPNLPPNMIALYAPSFSTMARTALLLVGIWAFQFSHATTTAISWDKYYATEWTPDQIGDEIKMLRQLATQADNAGDLEKQFLAHFHLAHRTKARDFGAYHVEIDLLDSLLQLDPVEIGDSMAAEFFIVKAEGLLLERFIPEAYRHLIYAHELAKRNAWPDLNRKVLDYFAYYYLFTGEYKKSRKIKRVFFAETEAEGVTDTLAWLGEMFDLGVVESMCQDYAASNALLEKVYALKEPDAEPLATLHYRMGHNYSHLKDFERGEFHLKKALEFESGQFANSDFVSIIQQSLARMYSDKGDYAQSTAYWQQTVPRLDSLKLFQSLFYAHINIVMNQFRASGDSLGLTSMEAFRVAQDSLKNREALALERGYRVQYETFEKEAEIRELELGREKDRAQKWALAGGIGLAVLAILFFLYRFRTRQRLTQQQLALEQGEKERLKMELERKKDSLKEQIQLARQKEQMIGQLKQEMASNQALDGIITTFEQAYVKDLNWDHIILQFDVIEPGFVEQLRSINERVTLNDTKMAILIKLGYTTASIADILNISREGVRKARQRLKEKVGESFLQNLNPSQPVG